jgi:hypothetical protein
MIDAAAVSSYADRIMVMIREDVERPFPHGKRVPRDIASFTALHDYLDANDYLIQADVPWGTGPGAGEDGAEMINAVCAEVSRRLQAGELRG